jgi:hypothetical protein
LLSYQAWLLESGAIKELRTKLRKEMFDLLLSKKVKNVNVDNDDANFKNRPTEFDLGSILQNFTLPDKFSD